MQDLLCYSTSKTCNRIKHDNYIVTTFVIRFAFSRTILATLT